MGAGRAFGPMFGASRPEWLAGPYQSTIVARMPSPAMSDERLDPGDRLDAIAHAVSDPTRRAILDLVAPVEVPVNMIADNFDVTRPAISQHLRVLLEAGLVTVCKDGTRRLYRARPEGLDDLHGWIESYWSLALDHLARGAEAEHAASSRQP